MNMELILQNNMLGGFKPQELAILGRDWTCKHMEEKFLNLSTRADLVKGTNIFSKIDIEVQRAKTLECLHLGEGAKRIHSTHTLVSLGIGI